MLFSLFLLPEKRNVSRFHLSMRESEFASSSHSDGNDSYDSEDE